MPGRPASTSIMADCPISNSPLFSPSATKARHLPISTPASATRNSPPNTGFYIKRKSGGMSPFSHACSCRAAPARWGRGTRPSSSRSGLKGPGMTGRPSAAVDARSIAAATPRISASWAGRSRGKFSPSCKSASKFIIRQPMLRTAIRRRGQHGRRLRYHSQLSFVGVGRFRNSERCANECVFLVRGDTVHLLEFHSSNSERESAMPQETMSKVPAVTIGFWIIKIAATTLGETGGDAVTMSWLHADVNPNNGGYLIGTAIFLVVFVAAVIAQILAKKFNPWIYWLAIVASTTVGTVIADFFDRSLGIGYTGGSSILLACVLGSLAIWYVTLGSVNVQTVATPKVEIFYWVTITFSQTLGTALGDWAADTGLGYDGGALVFGAGLVVLAGLYYWTSLSRVLLFWAAFILTRPLGATVGDFLDKPVRSEER